MPIGQLSNPFGVNAPQGNIVYTAPLLEVYATDPAGNSQTVTGISAANPAVVTTSVAHGFITGQKATITGVTGVAPMPGLSTAVFTGTVTVVSATTFSVPFNSTGGTYTSGGTTVQPFQPGQVAVMQSWTGFDGTAGVSGATSAPAYPTIALSGLSSQANIVGVIVGGEVAGAPIPLGASALVCTSGMARVYVDATTTQPTNLIQSAAHPGCAKTGTAASSLNIGFTIQVVTFVSPNEILCNCVVRLS